MFKFITKWFSEEPEPPKEVAKKVEEVTPTKHCKDCKYHREGLQKYQDSWCDKMGRTCRNYKNDCDDFVERGDEEPLPPKCHHTWRTLKKFDCGFMISSYHTGAYSFTCGDDTWRARQPEQRVCMDCGKCVDELQEGINHYQKRIDEENEADELAQKMWNGCMNT